AEYRQVSLPGGKLEAFGFHAPLVNVCREWEAEGKGCRFHTWYVEGAFSQCFVDLVRLIKCVAGQRRIDPHGEPMVGTKAAILIYFVSETPVQLRCDHQQDERAGDLHRDQRASTKKTFACLVGLSGLCDGN